MRFAKEYISRVFLTGKKPAFEASGPRWNVRDLSRPPRHFARRVFAGLPAAPVAPIVAATVIARSIPERTPIWWARPIARTPGIAGTN